MREIDCRAGRSGDVLLLNGGGWDEGLTGGDIGAACDGRVSPPPSRGRVRVGAKARVWLLRRGHYATGAKASRPRA
jgi:hypothetical protein